MATLTQVAPDDQSCNDKKMVKAVWPGKNGIVAFQVIKQGCGRMQECSILLFKARKSIPIAVLFEGEFEPHDATCQILPGATISWTVRSMIVRAGAPSSLRRPETCQRLPVRRKRTWMNMGVGEGIWWMHLLAASFGKSKLQIALECVRSN